MYARIENDRISSGCLLASSSVSSFLVYRRHEPLQQSPPFSFSFVFLQQ